MLSLFEVVALLLTATAASAWLNRRFLHLPGNIAMLALSLSASFVVIGVDLVVPEADLYGAVASAVSQIDFYQAVINGMLAFLLFAGSLTLQFDRLKQRALFVGIMATVGTVVSALLIGTGFWIAAGVFGANVPLAWALVFGALIAPTDPIAVLATLRDVPVSETLKTDMQGESLFNDGVAIVLFVLLLHGATLSDDAFGPLAIGQSFLVEAGGGIALGAALGYVAYRAVRSIDDYSAEVLISIAFVMATYAVAQRLHVSGPLAVVVGGVLIGNRGARLGMSDVTRRYVFVFWELVDDILNAVLFLLIGLEVLIVDFRPSLVPLGGAVIALVLIARLASVGLAGGLLARWLKCTKADLLILTWGGIRGGISIALALSLPAVEAKPAILAGTYAVVIFSVLVQALTLPNIVKWLSAGEATTPSTKVS